MKAVKAIVLALLVSGCGGTTPNLHSHQAAGPIVDFGDQTLALINSYRASSGLSPLVSHRIMEEMARKHSQHQARRRAMDHGGFHMRISKAKAAGLGGACTENVGVGYQNAEQLFSGWRNSRAHNANLLRPNIRYAGVSVVGAYSTFFACG